MADLRTGVDDDGYAGPEEDTVPADLVDNFCSPSAITPTEPETDSASHCSDEP